MKPYALLTPAGVTWALCGALASGFSSCSTPVTSYAPAQLLPVPGAWSADSARLLAGSRLCQGLGTEWDSALVVVPYQAPAAIRALPVANYAAVRGPVGNQELDEGTCTLLFVKSGRYTAYCVFPRTVDWVGFVTDKVPKTQLVWLTPRECGRLSTNGSAHLVGGIISYQVRLALP